MPQSQNVKIAVFVPLAQAGRVREAIGNIGAGRIGKTIHGVVSPQLVSAVSKLETVRILQLAKSESSNQFKRRG